MIDRWISRHDPSRVFLRGPDGTLTYGDIADLGAAPGVCVLEPGRELDTVRELMTAGRNGRTLVLVDPKLDPTEKARRRESVSRLGSRSACTVLFTSGTTGPARGVRLTEGNWEAAVRASAEFLDHRPEDVWLAAMPLHHVGGLSILYRSAYVGAAVRWLPTFDTRAVAGALREDVTLASLVPTMLRRILDHDDHRYRGLKAVLVGGGPIPPGLLEAAHARGIPALPTYGSTETCAQAATLPPGSPPRYAVFPLPGVDIRVGEDGRIRVRGAQVSPGYVDEDDRPPDEWFVTSDLGVLDDDGGLRVLGRADQVILTGGENVYPVRVEMTMAGHPDVTAAVVVGVPDSEWGEVVVAAYEGRVQPDPLREWLKTRLAPHEVPKRLVQFDRLPEAGGGKPDRGAIRAELAAVWRGDLA